MKLRLPLNSHTILTCLKDLFLFPCNREKNMKLIRYALTGMVLILPLLLHAVFADEPNAKNKVNTTPTSQPAVNLVKNPSVEDGVDQPEHWSFGTGQPSNFQTRWVEGGRTGKKCLWLKSHTGRMSGYWYQDIGVESGKTYMFRGYYRIGGGRMLIWIKGEAETPDGLKAIVDQRYTVSSSFGHWLTPVFLPLSVLSGPNPNVWYPFEVKAAVPAPVKELRFNVGMYFAPGELWFDDLSVSVEDEPPANHPQTQPLDTK